MILITALIAVAMFAAGYAVAEHRVWKNACESLAAAHGVAVGNMAMLTDTIRYIADLNGGTIPDDLRAWYTKCAAERNNDGGEANRLASEAVSAVISQVGQRIS